MHGEFEMVRLKKRVSVARMNVPALWTNRSIYNIFKQEPRLEVRRFSFSSNFIFTLSSLCSPSFFLLFLSFSLDFNCVFGSRGAGAPLTPPLTPGRFARVFKHV
jgi:hypothetical protein